MKATNINTSLETVKFEVEKYYKQKISEHRYSRNIFCSVDHSIGYHQNEIADYLDLSSATVFGIIKKLYEGQKIRKKGFENVDLESKKIRQFLDVKAGY